MIRLSLYLVFFFLCVVPAARAAEVNDEGAQRLETLFSALIKERQEIFEKKGAQLKTEGKIVIEQAEDYYAVTLPNLTLVNSGGHKTEIGLIAINATSTDNPHNWKMSVAIPSPILFKNKDGRLISQIDIGAQDMNGLWNNKIEGFSKLSAIYNDVKATSFNNNETFSIGRVRVANDLTETKPDLWSGPTAIELNNIKSVNPDKSETFTIKKLDIFSKISDASLKDVKESILKLAEKDTFDVQTLLVDQLKNVGNSTSFGASIQDMIIDDQMLKMSVNFLEFAASADNLDKENIDQNIKLNYKGLSTKATNNTQPGTFFPDNMALNISLKNLPYEKIIEHIDSLSLPKEADNISSLQVAAMQSMMTLPKILSDAGTVLKLYDTSYGNNIYSATTSGTILANPKSSFGATGEILFALKNIDNSIKKVSELPKQENNVQKLKMIKNICAKQGEGQEQQTICHIKLSEDAKLTVNGQDIGILLQMLSASNSPTPKADTPKSR